MKREGKEEEIDLARKNHKQGENNKGLCNVQNL
jgi:hypothetical protein